MMVQTSSSSNGAPPQAVAGRRSVKRSKTASSKQAHIGEQVLAGFCAKWAVDPDLLGEEEFDSIQLHLLACNKCASVAKRYEDMYAVTHSAVAAAA